jgi:hypothetical protein
MAILTDTLWNWSLPHVGAGGRGDVHRRFLANALRWLIRDPELSRVKVHVSSPVIEPDTDVAIEVRSFDPRYRPQGGARVRVTLASLESSATPPIVLEGETAKDGIGRFTARPNATGAWQVTVDASVDGNAIGADQDAFVVRSARAEAMAMAPRPDLLRALAAAGNGFAVAPEDTGALRFVDRDQQRVHRQKTEPIWNRLDLLIAVVALAALEWWWRRRRGFV